MGRLQVDRPRAGPFKRLAEQARQYPVAVHRHGDDSDTGGACDGQRAGIGRRLDEKRAARRDERAKAG